jgi:hypothetical protein
MSNKNEIILYETPDGVIKVEVKFQNETFWLTQKAMAELFGVKVPSISKHLTNIYAEGELSESTTISKMETVVNRGFRGDVIDEIDFYNLDAVIAVGYRVNSMQATKFRIWATNTLKEYIIKGFVLDDNRLKQGKSFGKDHFDELLARIRDIRASEKRFYQKIRDLFMLSDDYDKTDKQTELFFAEVQNKLLYAVTKNTAAELIVKRAHVDLPNMGLTSWKGSIVRKEDIFIAKNYLTSDEIDTLNRMVTLFLDTAELRVKDQIPLSLAYWKKEADKVIDFSNKPILEGSGSISHDAMKTIVSKKYDTFDSERKKIDAAHADKEDNDAVDKLIQASKKKQ